MGISDRGEGEWVKAVLCEALAGESPKSGVRDVVGRAELHGPRGLFHVRVAIAVSLALLVCCFAAVRAPVVAYAIARIPLVGPAYVRFLEESGLDVAYQAGLVRELGISTSADGVTLTVLGAYADRDTTEVMFTLSRDDSAAAHTVWEGLASGGLGILAELTPGEADAETTFYQFDRAEGCVLCRVSTGPIGFPARLFGVRLTLTVKAGEKTLAPAGDAEEGPYEIGAGVATWQASFPVRVLGFGGETVAIGKTIPVTGGEILLKELTFTPVRTILRYKIRTTGNPNNLLWALTGDCFSLVTGDGVRITDVGGKTWSIHATDPSSRFEAAGEVQFLPTSRRDVSVLFREMKSGPPTSLPLVEGERVPYLDGSLVLSRIQQQGETVTVTFGYDGPGTLDYLGGCTLRDRDGSSVQRRPGLFRGKNGIELTFLTGGTDLSNGPYRLELLSVAVLEDPASIVFEIKIASAGTE